MAKRNTKKEYTSAVGRRKGAVARVRLYLGSGESKVNDKSPEEYFPGAASLHFWNQPFEVTKTVGKYWVSIKVEGGGKSGQLAGSIHGIARALASLDPETYRSSLKKHGLLTRDARIRERRKVGTGGKARRKKQSPKR